MPLQCYRSGLEAQLELLALERLDRERLRAVERVRDGERLAHLRGGVSAHDRVVHADEREAARDGAEALDYACQCKEEEEEDVALREPLPRPAAAAAPSPVTSISRDGTP